MLLYKPNSRNYASTAVHCCHGFVQCCLVLKCLLGVQSVQHWHLGNFEVSGHLTGHSLYSGRLLLKSDEVCDDLHSMNST